MAISSPITPAGGVKAPCIPSISPGTDGFAEVSAAQAAFAAMIAALSDAIAAEALLASPLSWGLPRDQLLDQAEAAVSAAMDAARDAAAAPIQCTADPMLVLSAKLIDFSLGIENQADRTAHLDCLTGTGPCWTSLGQGPEARRAQALIRDAIDRAVLLSDLLYPNADAHADLPPDEIACAA